MCCMTQYYSCDSHGGATRGFCRPRTALWLRAPRLVQNLAGKAPGTYVAFGSTLMNVGRLGIAHRLDNPKTHELMALGYEG